MSDKPISRNGISVWAVLALALSLGAAGPAAATGLPVPHPKKRPSCVPFYSEFFGYYPTVWRPWMVDRSAGPAPSPALPLPQTMPPADKDAPPVPENGKGPAPEEKDPATENKGQELPPAHLPDPVQGLAPRRSPYNPLPLPPVGPPQ